MDERGQIQQAEDAARLAVRELVDALTTRSLDEDEFVKRMVALPTMDAAPRPDTDWYDAIVVRRGPTARLRQATFDGQVSPELYVRTVKAMLAAGHGA